MKREITPRQQHAIHALGIPGLGFLRENRRFYPGGPIAAHIVGLVNIDNQGIAGIEKYVDDHGLTTCTAPASARPRTSAPVKLSIDLRVQHIVRDELADAIERYQRIGGTGIVIDVHTGEVLAMVVAARLRPQRSGRRAQARPPQPHDAGVYELGSMFKSFTFAMALDTGTVDDERQRSTPRTPIHVGRFTIHDFHASTAP